VKRLWRLRVLKLLESWLRQLRELLKVTTSCLASERSLAVGEFTPWSLKNSMSMLMDFWA
jgi:hypothetical protein